MWAFPQIDSRAHVSALKPASLPPSHLPPDTDTVYDDEVVEVTQHGVQETPAERQTTSVTTQGLCLAKYNCTLESVFIDSMDQQYLYKVSMFVSGRHFARETR
ncbi:unnamed protein product [Pleuronectes platessa]|uniref:Uncharacterized protein n=1 Tax=Pleuronectes platessa TaxID=8262 RepID=A0A9N7UHB4_PLEPL|nr:unnamed protein product [Pleuronectes platessa]